MKFRQNELFYGEKEISGLGNKIKGKKTAR
jgi:hypothetical protein